MELRRNIDPTLRVDYAWSRPIPRQRVTPRPSREMELPLWAVPPVAFIMGMAVYAGVVLLSLW